MFEYFSSLENVTEDIGVKYFGGRKNNYERFFHRVFSCKENATECDEGEFMSSLKQDSA